MPGLGGTGENRAGLGGAGEKKSWLPGPKRGVCRVAPPIAPIGREVGDRVREGVYSRLGRIKFGLGSAITAVMFGEQTHKVQHRGTLD